MRVAERVVSGVAGAVVVLWFFRAPLLSSFSSPGNASCTGRTEPMPWGGCADIAPLIAIALGAAAAFVALAGWRTRPGPAIALALAVLGLAIAYPVHPVSPAQKSCSGPAISVGALQSPLCASPGELGAGLGVVLFILLVVFAAGRPLRAALPELAVGVFLLLSIGGVWLREVPNPPAFLGEKQVQLRVATKDLANNAALLRPGQMVQLVLVGQEGIAERTFPDLLVLGIYAADGHSVTYTGELPDNVVVSVPSDQLDPILTALRDKRQPAYLQGQIGAANTPTPVASAPPSPTPVSATVPLPIGKLEPPDSGVVEPGQRVVLLLVEQHTDPDTKVPLTATHRYEAKVTTCDAHYVYVSLERGSRDTTIENVTDQLAQMQAIYLLAPPPVSGETPTPTAQPTPGPSPLPQGAAAPTSAPDACASIAHS